MKKQKGGRNFNTFTEDEKEKLISYGFTVEQLDNLTDSSENIREGIKLFNNHLSLPENNFFILVRNIHQKWLSILNPFVLDENIDELKKYAANITTIIILDIAHRYFKKYIQHEDVNFSAPIIIPHNENIEILDNIESNDSTRFNNLFEDEYNNLISYGFKPDYIDDLTSSSKEISEGLKLYNNLMPVPEDNFFILLSNLHDKLVQKQIAAQQPTNDQEISEIKKKSADIITQTLLENAKKLYQENIQLVPSIQRGGKKKNKSRRHYRKKYSRHRHKRHKKTKTRRYYKK